MAAQSLKVVSAIMIGSCFSLGNLGRSSTANDTFWRAGFTCFKRESDHSRIVKHHGTISTSWKIVAPLLAAVSHGLCNHSIDLKFQWTRREKDLDCPPFTFVWTHFMPRFVIVFFDFVYRLGSLRTPFLYFIGNALHSAWIFWLLFLAISNLFAICLR